MVGKGKINGRKEVIENITHKKKSGNVCEGEEERDGRREKRE